MGNAEVRRAGKLKKLIKIAKHELDVHNQIKSEKNDARKKKNICILIGFANLHKYKFKLLRLNWSFDCSQIKYKNAVVPYASGNQITYRDLAEAT